MKTKLKAWIIENILFLLGIFIIITVFMPFINQYFGYIIKYDYFWLHIPYHKEFFRLIDNGLPLWSWNFFLGTNFWGSKSLSIVGDIFAWIAYFLNQRLSNLTMTMTVVMVLKFIVGYSGFFLLSKTFTKKPLVSLLMGLTYVFSGWSTTFIEQSYFTSFYMLLPFMFYGVELFLKKKSIWIYVIFTTLLISSNFYFFWPAAILLLIYWIYRNLMIFDTFSFKRFIITSLQMLGLTIMSLGLSAIVWLPGLIHLLTSSRLGNFLNEYSNWDNINIASFFVFSFIPVLKYLDGFLKDEWYYFNQMGLYFGSFSILLLPQVLFIFKSKKERIINICLILLLYTLMLSPKIGFIFHFTYSLRYTFIITFMGLIVVTQLMEQIDQTNKIVLFITEVLILVAYFILNKYVVPMIYTEGLPMNLAELDLLRVVLICTVIYTVLILFFNQTKPNSIRNQLIQVAIILIAIFEIFTQSRAALMSQDTLQDNNQPPYVMSDDYEKAIEYIKSIDSSFYRIYQNNGYLSNINLLYDYKSISTYDSVFQYSISNFLDWARLYPYTNWEFRFNEPSFNRLMNVRYAIIDTNIGENYMSSDWYTEVLQQFGNYKVIKYKTETSMAYTYNNLDNYETLRKYIIENEEYPLFEMGDRLDQTLYISDKSNQSYLSKFAFNSDFERTFYQPSAYSQNWMSFDIELPMDQLVFFSIPYDKGWIITGVDQQPLDYFEVQGGFIGLALDAGTHKLEFRFSPQGFIEGKNISIGSFVLYIIMLIFLEINKRVRNVKNEKIPT